jgi:AcrR family transcriptional regulator
MPKLKPDTQRARRERILDAAEHCFARAGFHRCTMQDICTEAGISAGALYVYFSSKEDLIAGLAERDRSEFQARFASLADAPDFMQALEALGAQYFVEEPAHKRLMCVEIGVESTRNPQVGAIFRSVDEYVNSSFEALFARLKSEGRIAPELDIPTLAKVFSVIGDGMIWRRAIDADFDTRAVMPAVMALVSKLLNPVASDDAEVHRSAAKEWAR